MAVENVFVLHGIKTPSSFYSVVTDATPAPLLDAIVQYASGHVQPLFVASRAVKPEIVFTTHQVGAAFNEFGLLGVDHSAGNVDLLYRRATDLGTRDALAAESGIRLRMTNAFCYLRSVRAQHRQEATAEVRIVAPFDGTNAPIVAAGSVAVTETPAAAEFFGLGPVSLNAAAVPGVQDLDLQLNPELIEAGDASEIYDTFAAIRTIRPVLTLRGLQLAKWTTFGLAGTALTAMGVFLRRKANDGGNVADATEEHASIAATAGLIAIENTTGGANDEVQTGLRILPRAPNAAGAALTLNRNVAIP